MGNKNKILFLPYGNLMRVVAVFTVMVLHSSAVRVVRFGELPSSQWWLANVVDSASRWCVPIFIMLSGALILDPAREESLSLFYKKRLLRVLVPLVFWSSFYFSWSKFFRGELVTSRYMMAQLLAGMADYHLYFLFLILGLYLIAPILRVFVRFASSSEQWAIALLLIGLASAGFLAGNSGSNAFNCFFPYLGYFLLGYLLRDKLYNEKKQWLIFLGFLLSVAFVAFKTGILYSRSDPDKWMPYDHFYPAVICESVAAFILIRHVYHKIANSLFSRMAESLGPASYGIYLVHVAVLDVIRVFTIHIDYRLTIFAIFVEVFIAFLASASIVLFLRRYIPLAKYVLG